MSEQTESRLEIRRDGLGISLFTAGTFFTVLIVLALATSQPLDRAEGTAVLARAWATGIGLVPGLLFCGGCAILGAKLFLTGTADLPRQAGKLALVSLALSVLLGAFSDSAGGLAGAWTAGAIARSTHVSLGVALGAAAFAGAVWIAWLRPRSLPRAGAEPAPDAGRRSRVLSGLSEQGVTAAEAAELIPRTPPTTPATTGTREEEDPFAPIGTPASPAVPISAFREDVRRRGEIPEGARPLYTSHVHTPTSPISTRSSDPIPGPALRHGPAAEPAAEPSDAAGEDMALVEEPEDELEPEAEEEVTEVSALEDEPEEELDEEAYAEESEVEPEAELEAELEAEPEAEPEPEPGAEPGPEAVPALRPSWEQSNLFQEEIPVDAYGTPLELEEPSAAEPESVEETEPAVVLTPVPAPAGAKGKRRRVSAERSRMLAEVGCLFVEQGRVAVSMLQKQFEMDFEEATEVLDELQSMGLIGPYLGGQRRDILLTRDEWLEKVSSL
jgi:DNA segregation ATPase FtsK/SpoIIIE-like protein